MGSLSVCQEVSVPSPPFSKLGKKLESMCRKALHDFHLLEGVDHLAVAVSGGKDSVTLLVLLHAILGRGVKKIPLTALHVSGTFSCGPALHSRYLQKLCNALDISFVPLAVETEKSINDLECYSCSRARRKKLFEAAQERGIQTIAFGHHRDDSIQTLLMNLLHKGEFAANLPKMPFQRYGITLIRPLIYIAEKEIAAFAAYYGLTRIVCQCPIGEHSMRKKTELMLRDLERSFPNARSNLAHASRVYGSDKALWRLP